MLSYPSSSCVARGHSRQEAPLTSFRWRRFCASETALLETVWWFLGKRCSGFARNYDRLSCETVPIRGEDPPIPVL